MKPLATPLEPGRYSCPERGERGRAGATAPRTNALSASLVALLVGCTAGPNFLRPDPPKLNSYLTPQEATLDANAQATAEQQGLLMGEKLAGDWWGMLGSQRLDAVLKEAVARNHTLAAAEATLAQAEATVRQTGGGFLPQADLSARASRRKQNFANSGFDDSGTILTLYSIGPQVSFNLDLAGGQRRQVEAQVAMAEFHDYQLRAAYLTLTGNAVRQALTIASLREQIDVVQEIIAQDEKNLALVKEQLAVGEATRIDLHSATSQLASDRTLLPPLRQQLAMARHALAVLVGKAPAEWSPPEFDLAEFILPSGVPVSLPSALVRQRPDILAAEAQLHAATAQVGVATAQLYPNVNLTASIGSQVLSPSSLFASSGLVWSLASGLTAPLFHGGALTAQKQAAIAGMQEKYELYQQTILASFGQIADVLTSLRHDADLVEEQEKAVASTADGTRTARESFGEGVTTFLQVLDAERQHQQARLGYVRAQAQRLLDTAQLFTAMGGGWWDTNGLQSGAAPTRSNP